MERICPYLQDRALFDVLAGGVIFEAGALGQEFSGKRSLGPAAVLAGVVPLHNPRVMAEASRFLQLGAAAAAPIASSAMAPSGEEQPAPQTPQASIQGGSTIGEQLLAKRAALQSAKAKPPVIPVAAPNTPALPFRPGAGISR